MLPPLSLYIHIPWCIKKCPYCDFNSHASSHTDIPQHTYVQRLIEDLEQDIADYSQSIEGRSLHSIFIGGGTPSLFSAESIANILNNVEKHIPFSNDIEITMEANPGALSIEQLKDLRAAGVNRLSIGIQSFHDESLSALGRIHDSDKAKLAIENAMHADFEKINVDIMHGLPHQSTEQALIDLDIATSYQPSHISWYQLTIEPNTHFYSSPPTLPNENILENIQQRGEDLLAKKGYQQYEVSAYAKQENYRAKHNINYWQFGDYLGIGAGAHGKITLDKQQIIRTQKTRAPKDYLGKTTKKIKSVSFIEKQDLALEFFMNALRLNDGFSDQLFEQRTGLIFTDWQAAFYDLQKQQLIETISKDNKTIIRPTHNGKYFIDSMLVFLSEH